MYWGWTATMPVDGEISSLKKISLVTHKDVCFPYSKIIMQNLDGHPRMKVREHNEHQLRYADDTVFTPEKKEVLRQLLDILEEESRKNQMELNRRKR